MISLKNGKIKIKGDALTLAMEMDIIIKTLIKQSARVIGEEKAIKYVKDVVNVPFMTDEELDKKLEEFKKGAKENE